MQSIDPGDLENVAVVIAFSGWNDAGNAATDAILWMLEAFDGEEIAEIDDERYYDFQASRPQLRRAPDGPWIQWPRTALHHIRAQGRDIIAVVGPEPSLLWRSFGRELSALISSFNPSLVVLLGAMLSDTPHSRPLPVAMYSYDSALQEKFSLDPMTYEGPSGIIGVMNQMLLAEGHATASLWVSIPHYVATPPNPKGQWALLSSLEQLLGLSLGSEDLVVESDKWTNAVDELSSEDPDVADYIEQLEEAKDASDVEGATGDAIAKEFERYLKGRESD